MICYIGSLLVSNLVLAGDMGLHVLLHDEWTFTLISTNLCAISIFLVCKDLNSSSLLKFLYSYGDNLWKEAHEVNFLDVDGHVLGVDDFGKTHCNNKYSSMEIGEQRPLRELVCIFPSPLPNPTPARKDGKRAHECCDMYVLRATSFL